jgi:hypothetical protein
MNRTHRMATVIGALAATFAMAGSGPSVAEAPPTTAGPLLPAEQQVPVVPDLPDVATDAGVVVVVTGANSDDALTEGDSNTVFSVRLPEGSTCPGDSANDDWRVQTFVVPASTDVGRLRYGATRPQGDFMYALYTTEGRPFAQVLLNQNPTPGQPGDILPMPALSFAPFTPDLLPVGRYTIGVACSYYETGERYWDAQIELTEDLAVEPGQRRWRLLAADGTAVSPVAADSGTSVAVPTIAVAVALACGVFVAALVIRRRRTPPLTKEYAR